MVNKVLFVALSKYDFQIIQNDILRFCDNKRLQDHVSNDLLHKKANLLTLEQRRVKQLLLLMHKLSKCENNKARANGQTRRLDKYVFKLDRNVVLNMPLARI